MVKRFVLTIVGLLIVLGIIFGAKYFEIKSAISHFEAMVTPPQYVSATPVKSETWNETLQSVGSLIAVNGVEVSSQAPGMVTAINFKSGQMVKKGDLLVQLNTSVEKQELVNFQAQYDYNKSSYQRQRSLFSTNATAQSALDEALSDMKQAKANVEKEKQLIAQKSITAPFSGKLGIREVNIGQYVNAGTAMVSLQSQNPLHVNFALPEQDISKLALGQKIGVTVDSYPGKVFYGTLTAISAKVDVDTRSILLQATIPNTKHTLVPGSYAQVKIFMPKSQSVFVVPTTAVTYRLYGDSLFVVKNTGKKDKKGAPILEADLVYVTVGQSYGKDSVIITSGVKSGVNVVISGQVKLQNKTRIAISNKKS
jgi:membrane fusion protein, multidrug efflux system